MIKYKSNLMAGLETNIIKSLFDGTKTEKAMDYAMSAEGGVNQQEGTELLQ